jgi:hypothetical protein
MILEEKSNFQTKMYNFLVVSYVLEKRCFICWNIAISFIKKKTSFKTTEGMYIDHLLLLAAVISTCKWV